MLPALWKVEIDSIVNLKRPERRAFDRLRPCAIQTTASEPQAEADDGKKADDSGSESDDGDLKSKAATKKVKPLYCQNLVVEIEVGKQRWQTELFDVVGTNMQTIGQSFNVPIPARRESLVIRVIKQHKFQQDALVGEAKIDKAVGATEKVLYRKGRSRGTVLLSVTEESDPALKAGQDDEDDAEAGKIDVDQAPRSSRKKTSSQHPAGSRSPFKIATQGLDLLSLLGGTAGEEEEQQDEEELDEEDEEEDEALLGDRGDLDDYELDDKRESRRDGRQLGRQAFASAGVVTLVGALLVVLGLIPDGLSGSSTITGESTCHGLSRSECLSGGCCNWFSNSCWSGAAVGVCGGQTSIDFDDDGDVDLADIAEQLRRDEAAKDAVAARLGATRSWSFQLLPSPSTWFRSPPTVKCRGKWTVAEEHGFHSVKYFQFEQQQDALQFFDKLHVISRVIYDPLCHEVDAKGANKASFHTIRASFEEAMDTTPTTAI